MLAELETGFRFNDAVLRHLTVVKNKAETAPSVMMKTVEREEARKRTPQAAVGLTQLPRCAAGRAMNRLVLQRTIAERGALRYTPGRTCRPST